MDPSPHLTAKRAPGAGSFSARLVVSVVLVTGIAGCGGGTPVGPAPPSPPPTGAPTSLAVIAGDGQSAFPGAVLAVSPAVAVRDRSGRSVPGAAVTFEVVSGGGSITGAAATSNAQGIAVAGTWRLGTSGEQIVEARHGNLTPARFRATIAPGAVDAVIPPTGGAIEITTAGHPFRGLKLTIPTGSYSGSGIWRFELAPDAPVPTLSAGLTVNGPALRVTTDQTRAGRLMTLRIPAPRVAGKVRLFVFSDPARSALEMAPIVGEDSESITVAIGHLNASLLLGRGTSNASMVAQARASSILDGFIVSGTLEALGITEALTGFLFNAWPAVELGSYRFPAGHGPAAALMNMFGQLMNQPYGGLVGVLPSSGVLADTASFASLQIMADRHRRSPIARRLIDDLSAALAGNTIPARDSLTALNLAGGFSASKLPQLMVFEERFGTTPGRRVFTAMFGKDNGALWYAAPASPSTQSTLALGPGGFFSRLAREVGDAAPFDAQGVLPLGGSFIYPIEDFLDIVPTMVGALRAQGSARDQMNRSLADAAEFPDVTLEVQGAATGSWEAAESTIVIRDSSALLRAQCADCTEAIPEPGGGNVRTAALETGSPGGFRGLDFPLGPPSTNTILNALGVGDLKGVIMTRMDASVTLSTLGAAYRAAVPINQRLTLTLFQLTPAVQQVATDSLVLLRADIALAPISYTIDWDFGDGSPIVRTSNVADVRHRFTTPATRSIRAELRTGPASSVPNVLLATARGKVTVATPKQAWRMTSLTKVAEVGNVDPNDPGAFWGGGTDGILYGGLYTRHRNVMHLLLTAPQDGFLYLYTPSDNVSFPQAFGVQRTTNGAAPNLEVDARVLLGASCTFAGCSQWWNLNITGDDRSGGINGLATLSTISAVKGSDGVTLTGTFRVAEGGVPYVDDEPALRPLHYIDYSFTAVRLP